MKLKLLVLLFVSFFTFQVFGNGYPKHKPQSAACVVNAYASPTVVEPGDSSYIYVTVDSSAGTSSSMSSFTVIWSPSSSVTSPDSSYTYAHPATTTTYTVAITNAYCGTVTDTLVITTGCTISVGVTTTPYYCSSVKGTATANIYNGVPPYTYTWNTGQTTDSISGLVNGIYTLTVKDSNGCGASQKYGIVRGGISLYVSASPGTIEVGDSSLLSVSVYDSASNSSYASSYTVSWSPTTAVTYPDSVSTYTHPATTTLYTVTITTPCGTYKDTVTVFIGCSTTANFSGGEYFCPAYGGYIVATASGGIAPYTYLWSKGGQTTDSIGGLIPGLYAVTVEDFQGCSYTDSVKVYKDQVAIGISATPTSILVGDSANLYTYLSDSLLGSLFTGPYTLSWSPAATVTSPDSAYTYAHPIGNTTYTVSAVTPCGTVSDTVTVFINVVGINGIVSPANSLLISPNPANGLVTLTYSLLKNDNITVSVIDEFGRIVYEKQLSNQHAGTSKQAIDLSDIAEGIYSLRMITNDGITVKKIAIVK